MEKNFKLTWIFIFMTVLVSCDKESNNKETKPPVPTVSTSVIGAITKNSCSAGGDIFNDGGISIISKGVCWSTSPNPTVSNSKTTNGSGLGAFTSQITGLTMNTVYYVRAYATNSSGTGYGTELTFRTLYCQSCRQVVYQNGIKISESGSIEYCEAELIGIKATPPVTVGGKTTKWECSD